MRLAPLYIYVCVKCGYKVPWVALTKRRTCTRCGNKDIYREGEESGLRYVTHKKNDDESRYEYSYVVFARQEITSGKRQRAIWQKTQDGLFITCAGCVSIVDISYELHSIDDGYVSGCVVCPECLTHFWAYLEEWKEGDHAGVR